MRHLPRRATYRMAPIALLIVMCASVTSAQDTESTDPGLVDLMSRVPDARLDIRYASTDNLVGAVIDGYERPKCLLSPAASEALAGAQEELRRFGLSILMFDCYRPQRAVDHFVRWSEDPADQKTRTRYYPNEDKALMFEKGYIDRRSGHSRGSTVDLTLVDARGQQIDMGTGWDFMDPSSATESSLVPDQARWNRLLLRSVMANHGFRNYPGEWWHFTLVNEPWPERYFDVPVR